VEPDAGMMGTNHQDFDNVVTATSSSGNPSANIEVKDFHLTNSFVAANFIAANEPNSSSGTVVADVDGYYRFTNTVTIVNDGPNTAYKVNFNNGLGNFIDHGYTFSTTLVQTSGPAVTLNSSYDGDTDPLILADNQSLDSGDKIVIEMHHVVNPHPSGGYYPFKDITPNITLGPDDGGIDETTAANKRLYSYVQWYDSQHQCRQEHRIDRDDDLT